MKMYTAISLTAVLILCATIADIRTNRMISKQDRKHAVICGSIIILCTVCEWCGQKIDGVAAIRLLHMCVRLIELCMAPVIGVAVAFSYGGGCHRQKICSCIMCRAESVSVFCGYERMEFPD